MTTTIQEYSDTEAALAELRNQYGAAVFDVTTPAGMKAAKEARAAVKGYRVALEKKRVEIKSPALERCKQIDTEAKRITEALTALEEPIDAQIKVEEQRAEREKQAAIDAEAARAQRLLDRLAALRTAATVVNAQTEPALILNCIADIEKVKPADFQEFAAQAEDAKTASLVKLRDVHAAAVRYQADQAELVRLRAASAERDAADKVRREQEEAAAAERRRQEEAQAAEKRRLDEAELQSKRAAQAAEDERLRKERERLDQQRQEQEDADAKRKKQAERAQRRRPPEKELVSVLAAHYDATPERVREWLTEMFTKETA